MIAKTKTAALDVAEDTILIQNVGAIERLEVRLEPGKVTQVTGHNGAGKSTAIKAVLAACGGPTTGLEPRDGEEAGSIDAPGIRLRIGTKITKKGQCETFVTMEDGAELQRFIDPGVKDPAAADTRRIEAMLEMAGVRIEAEAVEGLIGQDLYRQFESDCSPGKMKAVELVGTLKRWLHKRAQSAEVDKARVEGELAAVPVATGKLEFQDADGLLRAVQTAKSELDKAEATRAEALRADEALKSLQVDAPSVATLRDGVKFLEDREGTCLGQVEELKRALAESEKSLAVVRNELEVRRSTLKMAEASEIKLAELRKKQQETVTEEQIAELRGNLAQATETHSAAIVANQATKDLMAATNRRNQLEAMLAEKTSQAGNIRDLASQVSGLLRSAVDQLEGFSVNEEMRLCCNHERGVIPFDELSPGEKAIRALQVSSAMRRKPVGKIGVFGIPQPVWESLDDQNQDLVKAYAGERGYSILVAEASHGSTPRELSCTVLP